MEIWHMLVLRKELLFGKGVFSTLKMQQELAPLKYSFSEIPAFSLCSKLSHRAFSG